MRIVVVGALLLALGCSKQERNGTDPGPGPQKPVPGAVTATGAISAVTLGDDCGKSAAGGVAPKMSAEQARAIAADCPQGVDCNASSCKQTTMQLALEAGISGTQVNVTVAHVELFDSKGGSLGVLTAREPQVFDTAAAGYGSGYHDWDGKLSALQHANVMFKLSAPDWSKIGGQWQAQGQSFRLAVTLDVGGHKVELEKSAEVMIEPAVVT